MKKILVTGAHGDISLSILKILRDDFPGLKIFGSDCSIDGVGRYFFDEFVLLPTIREASYLRELEKAVVSNSIDLVIPGSEAEIRFLGTHLPSRKIGNALVILADQKAHEVGFDKFSTFLFLKEHNLPFPETVISNQGILKYPFIYKPREGAGSRGIRIINEESDLKNLVRDEKHVFQEYVSSPEHEYTCGLFSDGSNIRSVIIKRALRFGLTITAEPVEDKVITKLLTDIAKSLNLIGSINIQLRVDDKGIPKAFEINPRFSSTVYYRHAIGFKDLVWSIEMATNGRISAENCIRKKKLYRYFEDKLVDF